MSKGTFINCYVAYRENGHTVSAQEQATHILHQAAELIQAGTRKIAITYSANYGQTQDINFTYFTGAWHTHTQGANQAQVMAEMESLMNGSFAPLQGKMRILPITTMNGRSQIFDTLAEPWNEDILMGIVITDLDRIRHYLESGWTVLGWQNQDTAQQQDHPYAIGGGIARLPQAVDEKIQQTLSAFAEMYGADK